LVKDTLKLRNKVSNPIDLTQREKDILQLIAEELTSQEIADRLFISHRTVENYRLGLMQKLDAKNMVGMIRKAMQMGLVE
jgi:DNA-binding CsgD family transcriptional regulator